MHFPNFLGILTLAANTAMAQSTLPLRIVTWNIRWATPVREINEKPWSTRGPLVVSSLAKTIADTPNAVVIGMQEVISTQLDDIKTGLGKEWSHIGVGRDDGKAKGEFSPLLYQPAALRLLYSEIKWLSPTPDKPSYGWGAGSRRVVTIGVFEHAATGRRFIAANTHLDNVSSRARSEGVKVAMARIQAVQALYGKEGEAPLPVSLTGDFNSEPGQDAYTTVTGSGYLDELYELANASQRVGPYETYTSFSASTKGSRIDFAWLGPASEKKWTVSRYEVVDNLIDGVYASDHRMVFGDVEVAA
ncbi:Endonuclease/exonuclease/phosphatase [Apiospora kogelbergensis]|uniref:Endonuclease/exonuclease/phosphatase n=1 Tax=Apiospora kogelbergensis TaxID=1337665 RepID=A0AAW0QCV7_9PEZI